ncbi:MAG TPA: phosphoglucomutase/phosphomannomutase family protein [Anaerolineae bacterium]|nr:phosphoglucomutase/phosphomannomutase family protein [Anaerolineae bacterium]HIQ05678.1 phosphoglucomutase/phosphomannomutase family protein [Anaerolineae bacterium]
MNETEIRFGTDGWRARIAEDYTFANVRRCAQGFADYLKARYNSTDLQRGVVIGGDRRFQSEFFAEAAAEVMAGNGIPVHFCGGGVPTPVISYGVIETHALGAVNITASHNPPWDNGFKVRDEHGGAIAPEGLREIEALIPGSEAMKRLPMEEAEAQGLVRRFDPAPTYVAHLGDLIDVQPIKDAGLTVLVDVMWGNGAGWFPRLLEGGETKVVEIHHERNPIFPEMSRPEPIPPNVNVGLAKTVESGADVCLITDGDADRLGVGDEHGRFVNQLQVYGLLAWYMLEVRGERGPIVKTLSTTSMLERLGEIYNVPVYQTGVGFKYVAPKMLEVNAMIGGEESGGYAFWGHVPERDGILAGLYMLDLMVRTGKSPAQLIEHLYSLVGPHYYDRIDVRFPDEKRAEAKARLDAARPKRIAGLRVTDIVTTDGYKFILEDGGWLLVRFSGTEPIIRVYCEVTKQELVQPVLDAGLQLAGLKA